MNGMKYVERDFMGQMWGHGTLIDIDPREFFGHRLLVEAQKLARSDGCPVPEATMRKKGILEAAIDYANYNKVYMGLLDILGRSNPNLGFNLRRSVDRHPEEPAGYYESNAVPLHHLDQLAPRVRIFGWSAPRIILMGAKAVGDIEADLLEISRTSPSLPSWLVRIGEHVMKQGVEAPTVLSRIFAVDYLEQENTLNDFITLARAASLAAPDLWVEYRRLQDANQLEENKIEPIFV